MPAKALDNWPIEQLHGQSTEAVFRNRSNGSWSAKRARLHERIIGRCLEGKQLNKKPTLRVVMGGVGSGKSTLIKSKLAPNSPGSVIIDADQLWLEIPEYQPLARSDWRTAGERTYAEVRYLRDALLAEAAARGVDIILEVSGDEALQEVAAMLERDGYTVSVEYVHCSPEEARQRMGRRANTNPTPEDNLWCSQPNSEYTDKFDYQNVLLLTFQREYGKRKMKLSNGGTIAPQAR